MKTKLLLALLASSAALVAADSASDARFDNRLTGDWGGARAKLADDGVDVFAYYNAIIASNVSGGISKETNYAGDLFAGFFLANTKSFDPAELHLVEFALQPLTRPVLDLLKGTRLARQEMRIDIRNNNVVRKPKTAGRTYQSGADRTIVLYDRMNDSKAALFAGGIEGVRPTETQTVAHEFGHVVEEQEGIKKAFHAFVKKHKVGPITWYARSDPGGVFYAFP